MVARFARAALGLVALLQSPAAVCGVESTCMTAYNAGKSVCESMSEMAEMCDPTGACFPAIQNLMSTDCLGSEETTWDEDKNETVKIVDQVEGLFSMCTDPCFTLFSKMQSDGCMTEVQMPSCSDSCSELYMRATSICAATPSEELDNATGDTVMIGKQFEGIQQMCNSGGDACVPLIIQITTGGCIQDDGMPNCDGDCLQQYATAGQACANTPVIDENGQPEMDRNGKVEMMGDSIAFVQRLCDPCMASFTAYTMMSCWEHVCGKDCGDLLGNVFGSCTNGETYLDNSMRNVSIWDKAMGARTQMADCPSGGRCTMIAKDIADKFGAKRCA